MLLKWLPPFATPRRLKSPQANTEPKEAGGTRHGLRGVPGQEEVLYGIDTLSGRGLRAWGLGSSTLAASSKAASCSSDPISPNCLI